MRGSVFGVGDRPGTGGPSQEAAVPWEKARQHSAFLIVENTESIFTRNERVNAIPPGGERYSTGVPFEFPTEWGNLQCGRDRLDPM